MNRLKPDTFFYHIYPLGAFGAPKKNDFKSSPEDRLKMLSEWGGHMADIGADALYLGPVFESTAHGYDTADYYNVDRRLGNNESLKREIENLRQKGISVVLDAVFNHCGRDCFIFKNILEKGEASEYKDWIKGVDFSRRSPLNDRFTYSAWNGCYDLAAFNHDNPKVTEYLLKAAEFWMNEFKPAGLRLDAADVLSRDFMAKLRRKIPDAWLLGEVIHGDYRKWACNENLDSATNYELYKGLYSSHNDANYFEIAYSLNRQFGENGIYKNLQLYNFADNHDVNRIGSALNCFHDIYPLYLLLFTVPGMPSIYYGSESGVPGKKGASDDYGIRQQINPWQIKGDLAREVKKLAEVRKKIRSLQEGNYTQLHVNHRQFAFMRTVENQSAVVAVNSDTNPVKLTLNLPQYCCDKKFYDVLNKGEVFKAKGRMLEIDKLWGSWGRVLVCE